jgi:hypothetical protein
MRPITTSDKLKLKKNVKIKTDSLSSEVLNFRQTDGWLVAAGNIVDEVVGQKKFPNYIEPANAKDYLN